MEGKPMAFNFRTQEYEEFDDARISDYIPQEAQQVYQINVDLGMPPKQAALRALRLFNGETV